MTYLCSQTLISKQRGQGIKAPLDLGFTPLFVWWWWCYPNPSERWGHGGTPRRPNSQATPQGLDQRSKMEKVVPKMARQLRCWTIQEEMN